MEKHLTLPIAATDVVLAVLGRLVATAWRHFLLVSGEQSFNL